MDSYSITWNTPPAWEVTEDTSLAPALVRRIYSWVSPSEIKVKRNGVPLTDIGTQNVLGTPRMISQTQAAGSGCSSSSNAQTYDVNGNVAWKEDFNGYRTCYSNELSRNLEVRRVEGLLAGGACDVAFQDGASLPAGARKVTTAWHPNWRLETRTAEPRRLTTKVYNGQPDPFNGGATASCAPVGATLPDGSPIVVLCKQVEQATTDIDGSKGLAATVDSTVTARIQQWTYNQYGQVLTSKDPLNNTTTNAYYSDTTADHTKGDLNTVTNAKQQVTTFTKYNAAGQWLEMKDANGVLTTRTFDLRQRVKSVSTAGVTTSYDYWPTGLLKQVTLPDASTVSYDYDDAHRLTSITDNLGNSVTYTLDNSGNRTGEVVKDPSGGLAKTLTRVPDALNRIQQVTGRE